MHRAATFVFIIAVFGALPALAHHSFAASYNEAQTITIEGEVVSYDYRNPHTLVTLNVMDPRGHVELWSAEWRAPRMLEPLGVTKDTLHAGDLVIISGAPGREALDHKIHLKSIKRPSDGFHIEGRGRGGPNRFNRQ